MRMYDIIAKKRDGNQLSDHEINFWIDQYTKGFIPDYQCAALLMAIFLKGMNKEEAATLTMAMVNSGEILDLSDIKEIKVDKHSTGGIGDKTTLILAPLVASAGISVAKMSGRGLGHTGGTIDKLESIPEFNTQIESNKFIQNVNNIGLAIAGQTGNLVPADKKIYALRDVTATVNSIPLIASSIMSKKIASGADAIVLDVKVGSGAFMKQIDQATNLAQEMVYIGKIVGKKVTALITDMNQPLGYYIGNSLEVIEAIETLKGNGPQDLTELCMILGAHMLVLGEKATNIENAISILKEKLISGEALTKFKQLIENQGGNSKIIDNYDLLPKTKYKIDIKSISKGYVSSIDSEKIGIAALISGAGRTTKESNIDLAAGIVLNKKTGDIIDENESLVTIHTNDITKKQELEKLILSSYIITPTKGYINKLIYEIIT